MLMTCDNDCTQANWIETIISNGDYDLHVSHASNADLEGRFQAFCHDEQEMIVITGWMITDYEIVS